MTDDLLLELTDKLKAKLDNGKILIDPSPACYDQKFIDMCLDVYKRQLLDNSNNQNGSWCKNRRFERIY